ncbi:MAG: hypothetical protein HYV04_11560 [Deltaproteobacteria bacterium]|nr:hypothetical protein [Deltaproteobacteria bacterium]
MAPAINPREDGPRVFIHIGYHKTGSTFLQKIFLPRHPQLMLVDRREVQKFFLRVGSLSFDPVRVREWLGMRMQEAASLARHVAISDEELSGNIHTGGSGGYLAKEIADRLYSVAPYAHIVIFIRNQFEMIESCYRQYVKKGGTFGIKRYLFHDMPNHRFPQFSFEHFEYDKLIAYYIKFFGRDHMHVFPYEELRENRDAFLQRFFPELGLNPLENLEGWAEITANPSYSFASVYLARLTNRFYGLDPINRRVVLHIPGLYKRCKRFYSAMDRTRWIRRLDGNFSFLDENIRHYIMDRYAPSNWELYRLLSLPLHSYGYPMPPGTKGFAR